MCYRPLHIYNNSKHFDCANSSFSYEVPCGKCDECKNVKRGEWFIRSYYHWISIKALGGCAFFYTLTMNDENLPKYKDYLCFDFRSVQLFCKRLKERIRRKYGARLDYLITCEYGELYHRPHYHAIFFCTIFVMPYDFYKLVESTWQQGFVYSGKDGGLLTSYQGILYVTKYVFKDSSFSHIDDKIYCGLIEDYEKEFASYAREHDNCPLSFHELVNNHLIWSNVPEVSSFYNDFMKEYRSRVPFVCHSTKLGYGIVNFPKCIFEDDEKVLIPQGKEFVEVSMPRFLRRMLWYDRVPNERDGKLTDFVLSDVGKKHLCDTLENRITRTEQKYKDFFSTLRITDGMFLELSKVSPFHFDGKNDFTMFVRNLDVDWRKLAIYSEVYRNRVQCNYELHGQEYKLDFFTDYYELYCYSLNYFSTSKFRLNELSPHDFDELYRKLYNHLPTFAMYEQILILYRCLKNIIGRDSSVLRCQNDKIIRRRRDMLKLSNLKI